MYFLDNYQLKDYTFGSEGSLAYHAHTVPAYFAGASATNTIPASTLVGDTIVLIAFHRSTIPTPPTGFTLICEQSIVDGGITQTLQVYMKTAVAGDAGSTVTLTQSSAVTRIAMGIIVLSSSTGGGQVETFSMYSGNTWTIPAVTSLGPKRVALVVSTSIYTSDPQIYTITGTNWIPCNPATAVSVQRLAASVLAMDTGSMPAPTIVGCSTVAVVTAAIIFKSW